MLLPKTMQSRGIMRFHDGAPLQQFAIIAEEAVRGMAEAWRLTGTALFKTVLTLFFQRRGQTRRVYLR